jgi:hypothetical protein
VDYLGTGVEDSVLVAVIFLSGRDSLHVVVSPLIFQHTKLHVYEDLTPECLVRPHDVTVLGVVKTWVERRIAV